jgi:hypothetical protein
MAIGDPHTRPDEETVFVSESFDLARDAKDWAACALVPWALHLPQGVGARDIAALLMRQLHLQPGDVTVTLNQPEPYLIRFEKATDAKKAGDKGRFTGGGIDICLRPWRSLTYAMGFRMFYRVRLCLDGIPDHAWTPAIIERVIGHRCALQYIVTDLVQPLDTRHIELWAWTPDPRDIPKKVWLAFTHGPAGASSAVFVDTEPPPAAWYQGNRYAVFIHLSILEDYKAAVEGNLQAAVDNPESVKPTRRRYDWRYGLPDGAPPEARAPFPTRLPKPPRHLNKHADDNGHVPSLQELRREQDLRDRALLQRERERATDRERSERERERERTERERESLRARERERDGRGKKNGRYSCNSKTFSWPARSDDDDDDNDGYDHPGLGRALDSSYWGAGEPFRRERTRSPPRRTRNAGQVWHHSTEAPTSDATHLQSLFVAQAASLQQQLQKQVTAHLEFSSANTSPLLDFINKANKLATSLGLEEQPAGEKAWSDTVAVSDVFGRLRAHLVNTPPPPRHNAPSIQEVASALDALLLPTEEQAEGGTPILTMAPTHEEAEKEDNRPQQHAGTRDDSEHQQ